MIFFKAVIFTAVVLQDGTYGDDARVSLLRGEGSAGDAEGGGGEGPPPWVGRVEGLNYQITR
jgi:hypothetical protein